MTSVSYWDEVIEPKNPEIHLEASAMIIANLDNQRFKPSKVRGGWEEGGHFQTLDWLGLIMLVRPRHSVSSVVQSSPTGYPSTPRANQRMSGVHLLVYGGGC